MLADKKNLKKTIKSIINILIDTNNKFSFKPNKYILYVDMP